MLYLDRETVVRHLSPSLWLPLSQTAFQLHSQGHVQQPLRNIIQSPEGGLLGTMPAYISQGEYAGFGVKSVLVNFDKRENQASHEGCIVIYGSPVSGEIAAVDAGAITEIRTAAASAWATHLLASPRARRLTIIGTGVQARAHFKAMLMVRPIESVTLWGRNAQKLTSFAHWCAENSDATIHLADSAAQAVADADIICTVTAASTPFLRQAYLPKQCHINAVGASALGFQELEADVYAATDVFMDSCRAVLAASQCTINAVEQGYIDGENPGKELGELIEGEAFTSSHGRTLFKSVGLAVQDLVFAREAINQYLSKQVS